ncbi:hypothetical protein [Sulfurimonas sp.]
MQQTKVGEQNLYNQFGRFSLIFFLLSGIAYAESFSEFKRVQSESFVTFKDKRDDAFSQYLKKQWREFRQYKKIPAYKKQKPKNIIAASLQKPKQAGPLVNIKINEKVAVNKKPFISKIVGQKNVELLYFGTNLGFSADESIKKAKYYPYSQKGITNFFTTVASSNYENILHEIKMTSKSLHLNDWGIYLLVKQIAFKLFYNEDDQKLFTWFMLNKLSYNVKVALSDKHIILLVNTKQTMYATPRYKLNNKYFYILQGAQNKSLATIYTYTQEYPGATNSFDFSLSTLPLLEENIEIKTLRFKEYDKEFSAAFHYNKNLIDFLSTYPQVSYNVYFSAPMEQETYKNIAQDLKKYIDGKKASVAIDFLLKFVQKAFVYEVDQDQFNKEKVMFAEETLVYHKSDCEDRAILFAYLVRNLLGISVIGVKYSDHMATALYIPMHGDSVKVGKRRYVIADPTYVNATIGQSMPKYKSIEPQQFIYIK